MANRAAPAIPTTHGPHIVIVEGEVSERVRL
jgi:hypothetical protein